MQADTDYYESRGTGWKTFAGIMIIIKSTRHDEVIGRQCVACRIDLSQLTKAQFITE